SAAARRRLVRAGRAAAGDQHRQGEHRANDGLHPARQVARGAPNGSVRANIPADAAVADDVRGTFAGYRRVRGPLLPDDREPAAGEDAAAAYLSRAWREIRSVLQHR